MDQPKPNFSVDDRSLSYVPIVFRGATAPDVVAIDVAALHFAKPALSGRTAEPCV